MFLYFEDHLKINKYIGLIFVKEVIKYIDEIEYWAFLFGLFGLRAIDVEAMYPLSSTSDPGKTY